MYTDYIDVYLHTLICICMPACTDVWSLITSCASMTTCWPSSSWVHDYLLAFVVLVCFFLGMITRSVVSTNTRNTELHTMLPSTLLVLKHVPPSEKLSMQDLNCTAMPSLVAA